jgi:hypothetical protein
MDDAEKLQAPLLNQLNMVRLFSFLKRHDLIYNLSPGNEESSSFREAENAQTRGTGLK